MDETRTASKSGAPYSQDRDAAGKFIEGDSSKPDAWKSASKSDKLIKKYGGDIFSETRLNDGLFAIVDKNEPAKDKDPAKQQRLIFSLTHLASQGVENFSILYQQLKK